MSQSPAPRPSCRHGARLALALAPLLLIASLALAPAVAWGVESGGGTTVTSATVQHSGTWGGCTWQIDSDGLLSIFPTDGASGKLADSRGNHSTASKAYFPWYEYRSSIRAASLSGDVSLPADCEGMFRDCSELASLDVSAWDTSSVTDMGWMFYGCSSLSSLDVSGFDTSHAKSMACMFAGCRAVDALDVSSWDTSRVTDMSSMFSECRSLSSLDVSSWDTSQVTDMGDEMIVYGGDYASGMFFYCSSLTSLDLSGWDTSHVTDMGWMFGYCTSLASLDVSGWDTSGVTSMYHMFYSCTALKTLDLSDWDTSSVKLMGHTFSSCTSLASLDLSGWDTSHANNMCGMFWGCSSLASLDVSGFDTSSVTDMEYMFEDCSSLTSLDVSGFGTSSVTRMDGMFSGCSALASLDVSGFDTSSVTGMGSMFSGCSSLSSLDVSGFDTSSVTSTNSMFLGCSSLTSLDLSGWDTSRVTNMLSMFDNCSSLETIVVSGGWSTERVTYSTDMFSGCTSLVGGNGTAYDASHTDRSYAVIDAPGTPGYLTEFGTTPTYRPEEGAPIALLGRSSVRACDFEVGGCTWSDAWLEGHAAEYNHGLAATLCVLSSAAYSRDAATEDLGRLGCEEGTIDPHFPSKAQYLEDIDRVGYTFGTKWLDDGTPVVFVLVRGTITNIEWESNFNVADTTYPNTNHEGFWQAYCYLRDDLVAYLEEGGVDPSEAKFLVTGHSRGASVANILGHELNSGKILTPAGASSAENTYAYTFACPKCTAAPCPDANVFNIVNPEDTVPRVALGAWGFARHGRTLVLPSKSTRCPGYEALASSMRSRFRACAGVEYQPYFRGSITSKRFERAFGNSVPTTEDYLRDRLYYVASPSNPFFSLMPLELRGGFTVSDAFHSIGDLLGDGGKPVRDAPAIPWQKVLAGLAETKPMLAAGLVGALLDETVDNVDVHFGWDGFVVDPNLSGSDVITPFEHAHTPETYMSWMLEGDGGMFVGNYTGVRIGCPVDVEVRDSSGEVVCRIVGDEVDEDILSGVGGLSAAVYDGVKEIDVPSDDDYTITVTATDGGSMDVTCMELDGEGQALSQSSYAALPLSVGEEYQIGVDEIAEGDEVVSDWVGLSDGDGTVEPDSTLAEGELGSLSLALAVGEGEGVVDGPATASVGDQVCVCALPDAGWELDGWYEGGEPVSDEALWTFLIDRDRSLEARFARTVGDAVVSKIPDQAYTGSPVEPEPQVAWAGGASLAPGEDYELSYEDNVGVGTATVTITGVGDYSGTKTVEFEIRDFAGTWERLAGNSRYDTMAATVRAGFETSEWAVVAYGGNYPDALAAASLAGYRDCPVILTDKASLSAQARGELERLDVSKAYVMGGEAAVSPAVTDELSAMGIEVTRVAGASRESTSVEALKVLELANPTTIVVATGQGYADTLSIGPWCYAEAVPLLLAGRDGRLTEEQVAAIKACDSITGVVVVGGTAAVSDEVDGYTGAGGVFEGVGQLSGYYVLRLAGANRYETSAKIAEFELGLGMGLTNVAVATGRNYPDALAGSALCGHSSSVMLLADDANRTAVDAVVGSNASMVDVGYALGGESAVSEGTLDYCESLTE